MVIVVILGLLFVVFCISMAIKTSNYQNELREKKRCEEEERERQNKKELEHRQEMLRKAEHIDRSCKYELESLYNKLGNLQRTYIMSHSITTLSTYAAHQPVKKHDPYIRGGAASALGGPALGLYTALKTDEENRRNEEARNQAQKDLVEDKINEQNAKRNLDKITKEINEFEATIEKEYNFLNKASKLGGDYASGLKELYRTRDRKARYLEECRAKKTENAIGSENISISKVYAEKKDAQNEVEKFEQIIEKEYNAKFPN